MNGILWKGIWRLSKFLVFQVRKSGSRDVLGDLFKIAGPVNRTRMLNLDLPHTLGYIKCK